ncbi:MAG: hypothetical protein N2044_01995 [Cyclobacteriaceae bacterium]|nr:hypothetical protein [Cyclobacteriaceae bacterium]MCX7636596.1 hypothetical protein [Cyclobacteriaceae bacterium]MDW8330610.1 hypothetical protein [Cyclobacteriaceae bacterium]
MKIQTQQNVTSVKLVDGLFSAEEAREILLNLIQCKIQYHEMNNFSSLEQHGKPDTIAQYRLPELRAEQEKVKQLTNAAAQKRCILKITSAIRIELIDEGR